MNSRNSVNWDKLLVDPVMVSWSTGNTSSREVTERFKDSMRAGEFRNLVRSRGTTEARRLARKALRYRGVNV